MQNLTINSVECEGVQFDGNNSDEISMFCFGKPAKEAGLELIWVELGGPFVLKIFPPGEDLDNYMLLPWGITKGTWLIREKGKKHIYTCDDERFLREYSN